MTAGVFIQLKAVVQVLGVKSILISVIHQELEIRGKAEFNYRFAMNCSSVVGAHLTLRRHIVDLRIQQHGAGTERKSLVRYRSGRSTVDPQYLLFT